MAEVAGLVWVARTAGAEKTAQVWFWPGAMAVTPERPLTVTGTLLLKLEPFPSWPKPFPPQHLAVVSAKTAQVVLLPAAATATAVDTPTTATGTLLAVNEALPSWPSEFSPQQRTSPPVRRAQLWY